MRLRTVAPPWIASTFGLAMTKGGLSDGFWLRWLRWVNALAPLLNVLAPLVSPLFFVIASAAKQSRASLNGLG
ncbi:hypothetical protein WSK_4068 [Novosphingobium sp. Rr 2-17]|nr:hypothetical protein WSK_4068 [Novosphingobium sp. Rr 2-17]